MKPSAVKISGHLVTLPRAGRAARPLDGFWATGARPRRSLLIFVHGMGSNFYKSGFKKAWMRAGPPAGLDVLCFNNQGCESYVADERFTDCLADLDAALTFARREGYRRVVLLGHSTGCQKITYYQARRRAPEVTALILAALGDDYAIARRDQGIQYTRWIARARRLVANGQGDTRMPACCMGFTARRFLSAADPTQVEAGLFRLDGPLRTFGKLTLPILAVFPELEQYACIPVAEAADRLRATSRSTRYDHRIIRGADHGFHGRETACVRACLTWLKNNRLV
ncbi:MAG TPA: alpha/beta fold hydrolase [Kiritimatiellia bacterium]|nr:alpha/beta fold hydrolase [Kiritimatiellia bacterium]HMO97543.1 alpha/beta fold hydrolase [Kiritimatiellia bacterium]